MVEKSNKKPMYEATFFLTAGESNARGEMSWSLIVERVIEIATRHANHLGIGYANLAPHGVGWVLSRLGVQMIRVPKINEHYTIATWVENWNRLYSERCFRFSDSDGNVIGWGRSIWAIIDVASRRAVDLSMIDTEIPMDHGMECPMPRLRNHGAVTEPTRSSQTVFRFTDLDFNRHVNTVRYVERVLNQWSLSVYDRKRVDVFEIAFKHECLEGQTVDIHVKEHDENSATVALERNGEVVVTSALHFIDDPFINQNPS